MQALFFPTPAAWRAWLSKHHDRRGEVIVGFYKKASGKPSITWPESVDGALCFGWIDGIRHSIDDESYSIRFTPRKPDSNWSAVNLGRVAELTRLGLMHAAGLRVFEQRSTSRSRGGTPADGPVELGPQLEGEFRSHPDAWRFFEAQTPAYRRLVTRWVTSAARVETRLKRLSTLIGLCAEGRKLPELERRPQRSIKAPG